MEAQGKSRYPKSVLVSLDGSILAELALNFAESLVRASGARLILVRTVVPYTFGGTDEAEARAKAIDEAERYLALIVDRLAQHGLKRRQRSPTERPRRRSSRWPGCARSI
jgi:nucleotide-binding universal stress UspA family protein